MGILRKRTYTSRTSSYARARAKYAMARREGGMNAVMPIVRNKKASRKLANRIGYMLGEKKYLYGTVITGTTASGTVTSLSTIAQGDGDSQRDGDQITVSSMEIRGFMYPDQPAGANNQVFRMIIFQWLLSDLTPPVVNDVLLLAEYTSLYNHDKRYQFRILYDKTYSTGVGSTAAGDYHVTPVSFHFRINRGFRRRIQYQGGGTAGTNKIYALLISSSDTLAVGSYPIVNWAFKLNYHDN